MPSPKAGSSPRLTVAQVTDSAEMRRRNAVLKWLDPWSFELVFAVSNTESCRLDAGQDPVT